MQSRGRTIYITTVCCTHPTVRLHVFPTCLIEEHTQDPARKVRDISCYVAAKFLMQALQHPIGHFADTHELDGMFRQEAAHLAAEMVANHEHDLLSVFATKIQLAYLEAYYNPVHRFCIRRLERDCRELNQAMVVLQFRE